MSINTLDTRQLLAFRTLAETGSFTETAKRLHLTQSAISHSIRALEDQLECSLFDRIGKKAQLTEIGERLLKHTHTIFTEMDAAFRSIEDVKVWGKGRIRIGATTTACQYILPSVLGEFRECFPLCNISIHPGDTPELLERINRQEIDLAICLKPWKEHDFDIFVLFEDTMSAIVSPTHPLARIKHFPKNGTDYPFIFYSKSSYTSELVNDFLKNEGISADNTIELGSMEAIKELAKIGLGIGILADWIFVKEVRESSLKRIPIGRKPLKRSWVICKNRGHQSNLMENTFENLCQSVCDNLSNSTGDTP